MEHDNPGGQWTEIELDDMADIKKKNGTKERKESAEAKERMKLEVAEEQLNKRPKKPIYIVIVTVIVSLVLTIIIVPSVFAAEKSAKADQVQPSGTSGSPLVTDIDADITTILQTEVLTTEIVGNIPTTILETEVLTTEIDGNNPTTILETEVKTTEIDGDIGTTIIVQTEVQTTEIMSPTDATTTT